MTPEQQARKHVDNLLARAGWLIHDATGANISEGLGVVVREPPILDHGFADYLLYVDGKAAGVLEAKKEGATLSGVEIQSKKCGQGLPGTLPAWRRPLLFSNQSSGTETRCTNGLDPDPRARRVFAEVKTGDVLINKVGPPLGQVSVAPPELPEANVNQANARFRPIALLGPEFLSFARMSEAAMRWATSRAHTTAGQSNLTKELCRALPIALPPIAEQGWIVAEVERATSVTGEVGARIEAALRRSARMREAVLSIAFREAH